jgi:hypothetical protein
MLPRPLQANCTDRIKAGSFNISLKSAMANSQIWDTSLRATTAA